MSQNPTPEVPVTSTSTDINSVTANPAAASPAIIDLDNQPLSYNGLRKFLLLVVMLAVGYQLVFALAPTIVLFVMVFILAMVLNPLVNWLEGRGVKRGLAVPFILLGLFGIVALAGWLVVPPMLDQVNQLVAKAPQSWERIHGQLEGLGQRYPAIDHMIPELDNLQSSSQLDPSKLGGYLTKILSYTFGLIGAIFLGVIALLLLVFTLSNPRPLMAGFLSVVPERHRPATGRSIARIQNQMAAWAKATIINGCITGISTGILLHFAGVRPALVFGVLAFFGEFVPNIGPFVAAAPALFVAAGTGTQTFLLAGAAILFVQQVESNLLVPFVMGKQMELHPVTIVFFALAMGSLLGIVGAIIAVPTAATAKILIDEFYLKPRRVPQEQIDGEAEELVKGRDYPEN